MSNKKITELTPMTSGSLDTQDLLVVVDRSFSETKNMSIHEFSGYLSKKVIPEEAVHALNAESAEISTVSERAFISDAAISADIATSSSVSDTANVARSGGEEGQAFYIRSYNNTQISNLVNLKNGSIIYNSDASEVQVYDGGEWKNLIVVNSVGDGNFNNLTANNITSPIGNFTNLTASNLTASNITSLTEAYEARIGNPNQIAQFFYRKAQTNFLNDNQINALDYSYPSVVIAATGSESGGGGLNMALAIGGTRRAKNVFQTTGELGFHIFDKADQKLAQSLIASIGAFAESDTKGDRGGNLAFFTVKSGSNNNFHKEARVVITHDGKFGVGTGIVPNANSGLCTINGNGLGGYGNQFFSSSVLHVIKSDAELGFDAGIYISSNPHNQNAGRGGGITFQNSDVCTAGIYGLRTCGQTDGPTNCWGSALSFYTHNDVDYNVFNSTFTEKMRINHKGDVNIQSGSLNVNSGSLNVNSGSLNVNSGSLNVNGQIAGKFFTLPGTFGGSPATASVTASTNSVVQMTVTGSSAITITSSAIPLAGSNFTLILNHTNPGYTGTITFSSGQFATSSNSNYSGLSAVRRSVLVFVSDGSKLIECSRNTSTTSTYP